MYLDTATEKSHKVLHSCQLLSHSSTIERKFLPEVLSVTLSSWLNVDVFFDASSYSLTDVSRYQCRVLLFVCSAVYVSYLINPIYLTQ